MLETFESERIEDWNLRPPRCWTQRVLRLDPSDFRFFFRRLNLGDGMDVEHAGFNGTVSIQGHLAPDALHVLVATGADLRVQGLRGSAPPALITPPGGEFIGTGLQGAEGVNVVVHGATLRALLDRVADVPGLAAALDSRRPIFFPADHESTRDLRDALVDALDLAGNAPQESGTPQRLQAIRTDVLDSLESMAAELFESAQPHHPARRISEQRQQLAQSARHRLEMLIAAGECRACGAGEMSRALGVSPRTLQLAYADAFGVTYRSYERVARLHAAHAELRAARGQSVSHVALRFGFWHLGRFSAYYRDVYGVTPSEDLARATAGAA